MEELNARKHAIKIFWPLKQKENAEEAAKKKSQEVVVVDKVDSQEIEEMSEAFKKVKKVLGQFMPKYVNFNLHEYYILQNGADQIIH